MKLENQVCSLEQGERLKELGVIQESVFYHTHSKWGVMYKNSIDFKGNPTSAFTVAELGFMLPDMINGSSLVLTKHKREYGASYYNWGGEVSDINMISKNSFAESLAAMLIHLLENNHTTPEEVNQRLLNN